MKPQSWKYHLGLHRMGTELQTGDGETDRMWPSFKTRDHSRESLRVQAGRWVGHWDGSQVQRAQLPAHPHPPPEKPQAPTCAETQTGQVGAGPAQGKVAAHPRHTQTSRAAPYRPKMVCFLSRYAQERKVMKLGKEGWSGRACASPPACLGPLPGRAGRGRGSASRPDRRQPPPGPTLCPQPVPSRD